MRSEIFLEVTPSLGVSATATNAWALVSSVHTSLAQYVP